MPFQQTVFSRQAPAVAGDFASDNPREFYPAGPGGLVAGASGVTVGNFAWVNSSYIDWDSGPTIVNSFGSGIPTGIIHRNQVGTNSTFLSEASLSILVGNNVSLLTGGDIWVKNSAASGEVLPGFKAYANLATGAVTFALTGTATVAASATTASIAAGTAATTTGTISGNVLTTGATVANTIYPGAIVSGTNVATGTYIVSQLTIASGASAGGAGTYAVNIPEQSVASTALTITPSVFTPGTMQAGTVTVGGVIVASGVNGGTTYTTTSASTGTIAGMFVAAAISGTTWSLAPAFGLTAAGTLTSGTVVSSTNVETKWYALSAASAGELVRISGTRIS